MRPLAVFLAGVGVAGVGARADVLLDEVRAAWAAAGRFEPDQPLMIRYDVRATPESFRERTQRWRAGMSPGERDANRVRMEEEDRVLASGRGPRVEYRLWLGPGAWRSSRNNVDFPSQSYRDHAMSGGELWTLEPLALWRYDAEATGVGEPAPGVREVRDRAASYLLFGGLGIDARAEDPCEVVSAAALPDGGVECLARRVRSGWEFRLTLSRRVSAVQPLVATRVESRPPGDGGEFVAMLEAGDWVFQSEVGLWIAGHLVTYSDDGHASAAWEVLGVEPVAADRLRELTRTPVRDAEDSVRGVVAIASIHDYREGERAVTRFGGVDGPLVEPLPLSAAGRGVAWLRPIGWGIAACLFIGMVALRLRRKLPAV